jgi:hypothetical protein
VSASFRELPEDERRRMRTAPENELRGRIRELAGTHAMKALAHARDAQIELDRTDYSAAAVACHRAHQEQRAVEALREVLA